MQRVKLKQRILAPFVTASLFLFVLSLISIHIEERNHMDADFMFSVEGIQQSHKALLAHSAKNLQSVLEFIVEDKSLLAAYHAGDKSELLRLSRPVFERIRSDYGVTHFYFHDLDLVNVLRVHQPDRHGDKIERFTAQRAKQNGKLIWGVEMGPLGTFSLRAVIPWRDQGRLLGYIELAQEAEQGSMELASMFNVEIFLLISKQYLDRSDWQFGMRMLGREHDWDQLEDWVISYRTMDNPPDSLSQVLALNASEGQGEILKVSIDGKGYRGASIPLMDAGHRRIGAMFVLRDMSLRLDSTFHNLAGVFGIAFVIGLVLFGLFYIILSRIERQLEGHQLRIEEENQVRLEIQEKHLRELERLALFDGITGLPNRRALDKRLSEIIAAANGDGERYVLIVFTLRQLREINNTLGHEVGDLVLKNVSERIVISMSDIDTVASLGGGEFALLLPQPPPEQSGTPIQRLKELFSTPFMIEGMSLTISITAGVVRYPEHGEEASLLIRRGDVAMREAKRLKQGCELYDSSRDPYSVRRLTLASDLRKAIDANELTLHYQPQLNAKGGFLEGVEALARWRHAEHGMVSPGEFINLAERTGLIGPLTYFVLDEVVRQCVEWVEQGLDIRVSVNVSTQSLLDNAFPDKVASLLLERQLAPERLVLEVTESVFMLEPELSLMVLNKLKGLGVTLSIDDFGTGYSSLAYLKQLPVEELKIDQAFVFNMREDENDAMIVFSTISLAHGLGLSVVAEGVETREVWDDLVNLGCDTIQGYYVAKPMPAGELIDWLEGHPQFRRAAG